MLDAGKNVIPEADLGIHPRHHPEFPAVTETRQVKSAIELESAFATLGAHFVARAGRTAVYNGESGYLYDPALDPTAQARGKLATLGAGSTHAWLQVYLPGAGWVPFDPTNNLRAGTAQLIRVGVARDPKQAAPISGSWFGPANAYLGLSASVQVSRVVG